jgi:hypothetical protein
MDTSLNTERLQELIDLAPAQLLAHNETVFKQKPKPEKWSKQEILGHLIDSAVNNHQRFIRTQFQDDANIPYNQDEWNKHGYYNEISTAQLVSFWKAYNTQILALISSIPTVLLSRTCRVGGEESYTIQFLFNDYVAHQEYHLKQIIEFD